MKLMKTIRISVISHQLIKSVNTPMILYTLSILATWLSLHCVWKFLTHMSVKVAKRFDQRPFATHTWCLMSHVITVFETLPSKVINRFDLPYLSAIGCHILYQPTTKLISKSLQIYAFQLSTQWMTDPLLSDISSTSKFRNFRNWGVKW